MEQAVSDGLDGIGHRRGGQGNVDASLTAQALAVTRGFEGGVLQCPLVEAVVDLACGCLECVGAAEGVAEIGFSGVDRVRQGFAVAECGANGSREGAACAVGFGEWDAGLGEMSEVAAIGEHIDAGISGEVSSFKQDCAVIARSEFHGCGFHPLKVVDFASEQGCGFGEVGSQELSEGEKLLLEGIEGIGLEQGTAGRRDHYRIDDQGDARVLGNLFGDGGDDFGGVEHSGFDRSDRETFEQQGDLAFDDLNRKGLDCSHDFRGFRDHAGYSGESVNVEMLEGFEVRLNACAGGAIRSGDAEGHWR